MNIINNLFTFSVSDVVLTFEIVIFKKVYIFCTHSFNLLSLASSNVSEDVASVGLLDMVNARRFGLIVQIKILILINV